MSSRAPESAGPDTGALLCPSARCEEGAVLLGIVGPNGLVGYVRPRLEVDAAFVEEAQKGRSPERRFRFAAPCVEGRCAHWSGSRCGVADMAVEAQATGTVPTLAQPLPRCSIRPNCRWFAQAGPQVCAVCPLVITDGRSERSESRLLDRDDAPSHTLPVAGGSAGYVPAALAQRHPSGPVRGEKPR